MIILLYITYDSLENALEGGVFPYDKIDKEKNEYRSIQLHNLPVGYMLETVGKQLGNFFGEFLEYDAKNNTSIWRECMRVRIRVDARKPLKRRKKIVKKDGKEIDHVSMPASALLTKLSAMLLLYLQLFPQNQESLSRRSLEKLV